MNILQFFKKKLEKKFDKQSQKIHDKWCVNTKIDDLHQYLFDNNYIDKKYVHGELYDIQELIDKL